MPESYGKKKRRARLCDGDRLMDLGYSKLTDYAREEHGLPPTTARDMVKLARGLRAALDQTHSKREEHP